MAVTKAKKEEVLKMLDEKFGKAKSVYFADFRGMTVKDLHTLRGKLREQNVEYVVAKKTLMKIAAKNNKFSDIPDDVMQGPVGAAFSYEDEIAGVKAMHEFAKKVENLKILGGLLDGKYMNKSEAIQLATLPTKTELLAKLVGTMKAPISGFHGVLHGVMRGFVGVVNAYQEKKAKEGSA